METQINSKGPARAEEQNCRRMPPCGRGLQLHSGLTILFYLL